MTVFFVSFRAVRRVKNTDTGLRASEKGANCCSLCRFYRYPLNHFLVPLHHRPHIQIGWDGRDQELVGRSSLQSFLKENLIFKVNRRVPGQDVGDGSVEAAQYGDVACWGRFTLGDV